MQKISRTKTGVSARTSPAHCGKCTYQPTVTTGAGVRAERSALFYLYIIPHNRPFVKRFSKKTPIFLFPPFSLFFRQSWFFLFLYFWGFRLGTTRMSIGKSNKKAGRNGRKILPCMLLHKNSCWSLSEFLIYKTVDLRYNSYAVSNSRQVPFVAHCKLRFLRNVKLMTSLRGFGSSVCNFIFLFYIIIQFSKEEKMRLHGLFSQNLWKSGGSCGII